MISPRIAFGVLLLALVPPQGVAFASYWWEQPAMRLGWMAFAVWLVPLIWCCVRHPATLWSRGTITTLGLALASCVVGWCSDVNAFFAFATALSFVGLTRWSPVSCILLGAACAWMPLFDVVFAGATPSANFLRLVIAAVPVVIVFGNVRRRIAGGFNPTTPHSESIAKSTRKGWGSINVLWPAGIVLVVVAVGCLSTISLQSVDPTMVVDRSSISALPMKGSDFVSTTMPLDPTERVALGPSGFAIRRYVQHRGVPFILTLVDASMDPHTIHSPILCMGGRGWQSRHAHDIQTADGNVRVVSMVKNQGGELERRRIAYWFSGAGVRHSSFAKYRWQHFLSRLHFWSTPSASTFVTVQFLDPSDKPLGQPLSSEEAVLKDCSIFASL